MLIKCQAVSHLLAFSYSLKRNFCCNEFSQEQDKASGISPHVPEFQRCTQLWAISRWRSVLGLLLYEMHLNRQANVHPVATQISPHQILILLPATYRVFIHSLVQQSWRTFYFDAGWCAHLGQSEGSSQRHVASSGKLSSPSLDARSVQSR